MTAFVQSALALFLALRVADALNLLGGLYFVPRYVSPDALGAVLPLTSFATCLAIPLFALAMTVMQEASVLKANGRDGELRTLLKGVFALGGLLALMLVAAGLAATPTVSRALGIAEYPAAALALLSALLGCLAPIFTDQLQAVRQFGRLALVEILAAAARLATLLVLMPQRALTGYFAGALALPLTRIGLTCASLRATLRGPAAPYWTRAVRHRLVVGFAAILAYQLFPMLAALAETAALRMNLSAELSGGYYLVTRLSDALNYVMLPLLLVLFPHVAARADRHEDFRPLVRGSIAAVWTIAAVGALVFASCGREALALLPQGEAHLKLARHLPWLLAINALNATQTLITNSLVAAGRWRFLGWFVPLHLGYALLLSALPFTTVEQFLSAFTVLAVLRCLASAWELKTEKVSRS